MAVKKAKPKKAIAKDKPKKEKKGKQEPKPKKLDPLRASIFYRSIAETLQNTAFEGEFDLPTMLMRHLDKSHPDYSLGLHRAYYLPVATTPPFYPKNTSRGMMIFNNQSSLLLSAIMGEGIPLKLHEYDPPACKKHR